MTIARPELCLLLAATSCVPRDLVAAAKDRDDDGHIAWQLGGDDCDDDESEAHPDKVELCGDGIDNDCDGATDDDGVNAQLWYPDADGDGFAVDAPISACTQPADHRVSLDAGLDCDDQKDSTHPGAPDDWYDGIDSDCAANDDYDRDGDSHRDPTGGGTDCDDGVAGVHPGAAEVCGNHLDDDCDGTHNTCAWAGSFSPTDRRSSVVVVNLDASDSVAVSVGDVTGDGLPDLAARNPNDDAVFVFFSPLGAVETAGQADCRLDLTTNNSFILQVPVISGDLDGDGRNDLLVPEHGGTHDRQLAYLSPLRGLADVSHASRAYAAATTEGAFPANTRVLGDLDGDGKDAWYAEHWTNPADLTVDCYFVEGAPFGEAIADVAPLVWSGCPDIVEPAPDMDGDGTRDLTYASNEAIEFLDGRLSGLPPAALVATWPLTGDDVGHISAPAAWGDFDGDGVDDIVVRRTDVSGFDVVGGPFAGALTGRRLRFRAADANSSAGFVAVADFNGDQASDLAVVGGGIDPETASLALTLDVYSGPFDLDGAVPSPTSRVLIPAETLGYAFTPQAADIDQDGFDDLIFGHVDVAYVVYGAGR